MNRPRRSASFPASEARCPCRSGDRFGECCEPFVRGRTAAPTAVQLMRSRYTAFATGAAGYLLATWHPSTRPDVLDLDDELDWTGLTIVATDRGGPFDTVGTVEFVARFREGEARGRLHEVSRFVREGGRWSYVDGVVG